MPVHRPAVKRFLDGPLLAPPDLSMVLLVREDDDTTAGPMPTVAVGEIPHLVKELSNVGIRSVKVFAGSRLRDSRASQGASPHGLMMRAIRAAKEADEQIAVMTETCLCAHTDTGECYLGGVAGVIDMAATAEAMALQAVAQAEAGADIVGPAAMMPGTTSAVRAALDDSGHKDVAIMPHLILDSVLYEGYRTAMGAAPASGTRAFQIPAGQSDTAVQAGVGFLDEGADMLLLEPAAFTVDTLLRIKAQRPMPLMPFSVSGEYLRLTRETDDGRDVDPLVELFTMLKRSGADRIITYAALDVARSLG
ncbi:hypothetical protein [Streptomyces blastmyceticus]|uniref:Delta-aminolevulinic acid dehydratase n=1 Tax=Streptomyces blastmyceticus TaxID=68180 RepID=A0ABP3HU74_9ACTN